MKTFDFDFEEKEKDSPIKNKEIKDEPNYDFKGLDVKVGHLVKFYVINEFFNMKSLLEDLGYSVPIVNMFCPFHEDEAGGKPSAKYHEDTDLIYCFSESRTYSAYHVLKILYAADMETKFLEAWNGISESRRAKLLAKYDNEDGNTGDKGYSDPIWNSLRVVHSKFSKKEVNFKQHKNALYKIFNQIYDEEVKKKEILLRR